MMTIYKGDIIQFCMSNLDDCDTGEVPFMFTEAVIEARHRTHSVKFQRIDAPNRYLARNAERFNVILSEETDHKPMQIRREDIEGEYLDRPINDLIEIVEEPDDEEED